ncbi:MAG: amino acid permease, partial [Clostridiales bacterium]|nr:amino acid permease [Clostridiales bacterium]
MSSTKSTDSQGHKLHRSLKVRHMSMIAIGASIGTGLFLTSGSAFSSAGPGGAVAAFVLMGLLVYFVIISLGEMSALLPISGSFETYASRFVDPAFGFAIGWNYWFSWAITLAVEVSAATIIIEYWMPDANAEFWAALFLVFLFAMNYAPAKFFGESEYWFAGIKVVTVIIFLVIGVLMILGIMGGTSPGFENWTLDDGRGNRGPFIGGFGSMLAAFMSAGFSFLGVEMVALTAGEAENPAQTIPKAIKTVFFRIMIFYLGTIIVIGFLIPFTNPNLLGATESDITLSPFTM